MLQSFIGDTWVYMPSAQEIFEAFIDLNLKEKSILAATCLWLLILFLPLKGIDPREMITAGTYVLFLVGSGVILAASAPSRLIDKGDFGKTIALMSVLIGISGLRWIFYYLKITKKKEFAAKGDLSE